MNGEKKHAHLIVRNNFPSHSSCYVSDLSKSNDSSSSCRSIRFKTGLEIMTAFTVFHSAMIQVQILQYFMVNQDRSKQMGLFVG